MTFNKVRGQVFQGGLHPKATEGLFLGLTACPRTHPLKRCERMNTVLLRVRGQIERGGPHKHGVKLARGVQ